jgi:hypothetical protein
VVAIPSLFFVSFEMVLPVSLDTRPHKHADKDTRHEFLNAADEQLKLPVGGVMKQRPERLWGWRRASTRR